jgi:tRNA(Ile)-lysidine synthase
MDLQNRLSEYVKTNGMFHTDERLLTTVSGGVDSVVMAHLIKESGCAFGIAHCNFQLRGAESDADELFVRALAESWDVPFFVTHFETKVYAGENAMSVQMAARDLRYNWFEQIRVSEQYNWIVTGHNLNDAIETSLFNFTRGAGLKGLASMAPVRGKVIRPLLFATRQEIEAFAVENNIAWREESSNATDDYSRNFIRHHVIRQLEALNPGFLQTAGRNLVRLRATDANYQYMLDQEFGVAPTQIDKKKLAAYPAPFQILRTLLRPHGFTEEQCRQMAESLAQTGMEWFSSAGYRVLNDRHVFTITTGLQTPPFRTTIEAGDLMISLPGQERLFLTPASPQDPIPSERTTILVDADALRFPLVIRTWQPGDAFQPLGMGGRRQKLQDFFTNRKLSRLDKEHSLILENGDGSIIWVVGYRLDERFKIAKNTKNAFKINRVVIH